MQIDNINKKYPGTGLGLTITKSLTNMLEGTIDVDSELNKGTKFTITIPKGEIEIQNKKDESTISSYSWNNKTILIAEDNDFNMIILEEIFRETNVKIISAMDGIEVIKKYKENIDSVDLVLMDIQMPLKSGYEATKEIIEMNPKAKIIAQTAFAISNEKDLSIEAGCVDYITKPIQETDLLELINKYLN